MWSDSEITVQEPKTFIEAARRAQIISAAIETIAEVGYGQSSLARIAQRAGISKGVIGYHFAGKDELLVAVVADVLAKGEEFMRPRVAAQSTGPGLLRAYIGSNLAFMGQYRDHVIAIVEIARNARRPDGTSPVNPTVLNGAVQQLSELFGRFQRSGEFRSGFDPAVMATALRAAIDTVPRLMAIDPALDVDHYARELADLFDLATRNPA